MSLGEGRGGRERRLSVYCKCKVFFPLEFVKGKNEEKKEKYFENNGVVFLIWVTDICG